MNNQTQAKSIQLYNSLGGELVFDTNMFNYYKFSFGFRYSYLFHDDPLNANVNNTFEFFIPLVRF
ncbi:MAG: hypothetical protein HC819_22985 [Cyclobacteriaceae bacterium]|nr:hypothetical protein [Cyclobacteriaceae bacterium]